MLVTIVIVVVLLIGALLAAAAARPDEFRVERAATIAAPAAKIFPLIDDFRQWASWSPYERLDPAMRKGYGGAASGKGATYEWDGKKAGAGRMLILDSTPPSKISIDLTFTKPMKAHNTAEFTLVPSGDGTVVTWAVYGRNSMVSKLFSLVVNMDNLLGKDFAAGLATLKALAER